MRSPISLSSTQGRAPPFQTLKKVLAALFSPRSRRTPSVFEKVRVKNCSRTPADVPVIPLLQGIPVCAADARSEQPPAEQSPTPDSACRIPRLGGSDARPNTTNASALIPEKPGKIAASPDGRAIAPGSMFPFSDNKNPGHRLMTQRWPGEHKGVPAEP